MGLLPRTSSLPEYAAVHSCGLLVGRTRDDYLYATLTRLSCAVGVDVGVFTPVLFLTPALPLTGARVLVTREQLLLRLPLGWAPQPVIL